MTKEEFHERVLSNTDSNDGFAIHCKHLYNNNGAKSLFYLTGIDFSNIFQGKEDTSGIRIQIPSQITKIEFIEP